MKKKIFYVILSLSIALTIVTGILTAVICYGFYMTEAENQVRTLLQIAAQRPEDWRETENLPESARKITETVNYRLRVSVILKDGTVIYDNFADTAALSDHSLRPEVEAAITSGQGENIRYSDTLKTNVYYCARLLDSGTVLRFSREINSIRSLFAGAVPLLTVMILLIITTASFLASWFTGIIIRPVNYIASSLDEITEKGELPESSAVYDELLPFAEKIRKQKMKINEYIAEIKRETQTINIITQNMQEGFILLDGDGKILTINQSAARMMGNEKFDLHGGRNIVELTRVPAILGSIDEAIRENRHLIADMEQGSGYFRYYMNPVAGDARVKYGGLFILIEDITVQKQGELMRREFSANVSHELKTPLTTINGFAEMIKEGLITDPESVQKYNAMINKEGNRLITLIDDIIRLSEIEEGRDIQNVDIGLSHVCEEACGLLRAKAESRGLSLTFEAENIVINANKNYINELLYNLIDNAIKYNKEGGSVLLSIKRESDMAVIRVTDTGVGISQEHLGRIFERFYRVDKSRSKDTGGTGLGLSIVKHIAELYKGTAEIKSTIGEGTCVIVKLQLDR